MINMQPSSEEIKKLGTPKAVEGAAFWGYPSPQHHTSSAVTSWTISITQQDGNWAGQITSDNPQAILQTPKLSGVFEVKVTASGPKFPETTLQPLPDSKPDIGCNSNCYGMVGIVANEDGKGARYWTVWDAFCDPTGGSARKTTS